MKKSYKDSRLYFYEVSKEYLDYLRKFESRIPNIEYANREKFVAGVLFKINDLNYLAPVSSFNKKQYTNYVMKFGEYPVGSIRFSFMMPVPDSELHLKDFSNETQSYKRLVIQELQLCNKNRSTIRKEALNIYNRRTSNLIPFLNDVCCDFKKLESQCQEWIKVHDNEILESKPTVSTIVSDNSLSNRINKAIKDKQSKQSTIEKKNEKVR